MKAETSKVTIHLPLGSSELQEASQCQWASLPDSGHQGMVVFTGS